MAGAGAPPCTTSIMWSVFEMWKLQQCNSEYNYDFLSLDNLLVI